MSTITQDLKKLRLNYLAENLEEFSQGCKKASLEPIDILEKMVQLELVERSSRSTHSRLKQSRIGKFKNILEFDWAFPKKIDRTLIEELLKGDFIDEKQNLILAGAQGLGKTMIAKNIAYQSILKGKKVLFTTASQLVLELNSKKDNHIDFKKAIAKYTNPDLLIIDELGYLSYDCNAADAIFEIVNRRYEQGSLIITTNLAFKDWNTIFPGANCLSAMIDRLTHHLKIVKIEGPSFRLEESKRK